MKQVQVLLLTLAAGLILAGTGCSPQNLMKLSRVSGDTVAFRANTAYEYRIRKDDKVSVSIWDHDDLSVGSVYGIYNSNEVYGKWLLVDVQGEATLPKAGKVHLEGYTIREAEAALTELYKKWIVTPVIEVKVQNKEVTVLGEFKTPGKYLLERDNNTLLDVIGKAGDFDFYANKRKVMVIRKVNGVPKKIEIDLTRADAAFTENIQIYPGDIVYAPSRNGKAWDKRAGSTIVPLTAIISSAVIIKSVLK